MQQQQAQLQPNSQHQYLKGSLITHQTRQSLGYRLMTKLDFFSFIPVPKDAPVSTKPSMIGSVLFILAVLVYTGISFYYFVTDNPPGIETYSTKLDQQFYQMPRVAVAFMYGDNLNETSTLQQYYSFTFTKQLKSTNLKQSTLIETTINDPTLNDWLTNDTLQAYQILRSPSQPMMAKGLLYSSYVCNYTRLLIKLCNIDDINGTCVSLEEMRSMAAKGRVFVFIQDVANNASVSKENNENQNKFILANFFLEPGLYKRATISFRIIQTQIFPDYFNRFSTQYSTRLVVDYITEQSSNTSINDYQKNQTSLQMLAVFFQLSPQVDRVRMSYVNIFDYISKWGAFINVIFTVFAIFLLNLNRKKFYDKNPQWDQFRKVTKKKFKSSVRSS